MPAMRSAASTLAIRDISSTPGPQHSVASRARKTLEVRHTGTRPGPSVAKTGVGSHRRARDETPGMRQIACNRARTRPASVPRPCSNHAPDRALTHAPRTRMLSPSRSGHLAFDPKSLDELARKLAEAVPPGLAALRNDLEQNFKAVLQGGLAKLDLVTRQEFDIQAAVLRRSRERLEELEKRIAALEKSPPRK